MNQFRADLHIHSRYSRATSKKLTPALLAAWGKVKGLHVLGTGDITHGVWRKELQELLQFDEESGLYRLLDPRVADAALPQFAGKTGRNSTPLFMLQGEISSIYKRGGKVRKVHNLVYLPDFAAAEKFCVKLSAAGNVESDGRPILGLDSRDLLEILLETDPRAFLIPAHIWTPWFSLFGSKSGFDALNECFGDLSSEIFALETGLSSDPAMNRLLSALDSYALVSNSDAHSGENLGREANLFSGVLSYEGIYRALKGFSPDTRFDGTLEFYPEEGKYHLDGHRKCNVVLSPEETRSLGGICPACGKPLTVGVLSRVRELADREEAVYAHPAEGKGFSSLIPLMEIVAEVFSCGAKTKKVEDLYARIIERFGSELDILQSIPVTDLARFMPPLGEGIDRMRKGLVTREGGYDGEYGVVRVFSEKEISAFRYGGFAVGASTPLTPVGLILDGREAANAPRARKPKKTVDPLPTSDNSLPGSSDSVSDGSGGDRVAEADASARDGAVFVNEAQERAVRSGPGPVLVLAGPGTGKTHTLSRRVVRLLEKGTSFRHILAVTFTRRAAGELDERLNLLLQSDGALSSPAPRSDTLHALAFELWHRTHDEAPTLLSEEAAKRVFSETNPGVPPAKLREAWEHISLAREKCEEMQEDIAAMYQAYTRQKGGWNLADYTDLLEFWLERIQTGLFLSPWVEILVDEIQDLSTLQLRLVKALLPKDGKGFFGIGDPDQSIYSFRGTCPDVRGFLQAAWPGLESIPLRENYRSRAIILQAASNLLGEKSACGPLVAAQCGERERERAADAPRIHLFAATTAEAEASWVAARVRALIGGGSLTLREEVRKSGLALPEAGTYSPGDIAILVRMRALAPVLQKALTRVGLLASVPEAEAFWMDERVARLIREAGRMLGVLSGNEEDKLPCSDAVLAKGPAGIAAYFDRLEFFDALFWQSAAFRTLDRAYKEYGGWQGVINWVNLQTELELVKNKSERVQIMSLHAAKGLEFKTVFLPALEDGILPYAGTGILTGQMDKSTIPPDEEEERRLLYVGLTRARDSLFLSLASNRKLFGKALNLKPSRFLADLPLEAINRSAMIAKKKREETRLNLL